MLECTLGDEPKSAHQFSHVCLTPAHSVLTRPVAGHSVVCDVGHQPLLPMLPWPMQLLLLLLPSLALADRVGVGADGAGGDDGGLDGVGVLLLGEVLVEEGGELT